jgi:RimJ/RimL family protein N-acetyltransferase
MPNMDDAAAPRIAGRPGERWVIRLRLSDGSATDVTGWLESVAPDRLRLRRRAGDHVDVKQDAIIAARRVNLAYGGQDPRRTSAAALEQIAARGWVAAHEPLGAWVLRAGSGFTRRANSCLAVGDPGLPFDEAAVRVIDHADRHGITPRVQVIEGSAEEEAFRALGWREAYVRTAVLVTRLSSWLGEEPPDPRVMVSQTLTPAWEAAYHQSRSGTADPEVVRRILTSSPPRAFASLPPAGQPQAIGRGHVKDEWLGIASVWTAPDHRRRGWAALIMRGLGSWAAGLGARSVYLQVAAADEAAVQAYGRLGFALHHHYRYLSPDGGPGPWTGRDHRRDTSDRPGPHRRRRGEDPVPTALSRGARARPSWVAARQMA